MAKFKGASLFLLPLLLSSCQPGASTGLTVDLYLDAPISQAPTLFEALPRRNGDDLVAEWKAGYSGLVYLASSSCEHCEQIADEVAAAVTDSGFLVSLVYMDGSDRTSFDTVGSYLREVSGNEEYGKYTPSLYYVAEDDVREVFVGSGGIDADSLSKTLKNNFAPSHVHRGFLPPSSLNGDRLSVLVDLSNEYASNAFLEEVRESAESTGREVDVYDYSAANAEEKAAFCSLFRLDTIKSAVSLNGESAPFESAEGRKLIEGYFA